MELPRDFIEKSIFSVSTYDDELSYFDNESIVEIYQIAMVDYGYEERMITAIRNIKSYEYQEARRDYYDSMFASDVAFLRRNMKSLLKGLIATSTMVSLSEINDAKVRWKWYETKSDYNDPQGHHNIVYLEFKKVETLEDLRRFNIYFHEYILNLILGTAETFIKRLRYTIEYFQNDRQFEEACATGLQNIEKFKKELEEARNFKPFSNI